MVTVRTGRSEDRAAVARLWLTWAQEIGPRRGGEQLIEGALGHWVRHEAGASSVGADAGGTSDTVVDDVARFLTEAGRTMAARLWVGALHGADVGFAFARVHDRAGRLPRRGSVEMLFVEPEARGVGVGEELMAAAEAWLEEEGCATVDALALPGDRAAKNFLEGSGYRARLLVLSRSLLPG